MCGVLTHHSTSSLMCILYDCILMINLILSACTTPLYYIMVSIESCTAHQGCPHKRGVLTRGVPHKRDVLTAEVSSLQRCPHYRGVLTTEVSSLQRCPHYRGVLATEVSSLQRCPHYRGVLATELSSLQRCPHYRGVLTTGVSSLPGVFTTEVSSLQRCPHNRGVFTTEVSSLQRCPHYRGVLATEVSSLQCRQGMHYFLVNCQYSRNFPLQAENKPSKNRRKFHTYQLAWTCPTCVSILLYRFGHPIVLSEEV